MSENNHLVAELIELREQRKAERRNFLRGAGCMAAVASLSVLSGCDDDDNNGSGDSGGVVPTPTPTPAPTPTPTSSLPASDVDILNFALNLEYLEAQFYSFAVNGVSLPGDQLTGTGTAGAPTGARQVTFTDAAVARYAREIATNEARHVAFLRSQLAGSAIAQPNLDLSPGGAFTALARSAGVVSASGTFDPYASDENFLLAAFAFEDVGVTAYKGAASLLTNKGVIEASAGILATEAYHAGLLRTVLYRKGLISPALRTNADLISNARDNVDGNTTSAGPPQLYADDDQGISPTTINGQSVSNIVPSDANGIAFGRAAADVLNIVYLNAAAVSTGGFFPTGVNGNIKTSSAT